MLSGAATPYESLFAPTGSSFASNVSGFCLESPGAQPQLTTFDAVERGEDDPQAPDGKTVHASNATFLALCEQRHVSKMLVTEERLDRPYCRSADRLRRNNAPLQREREAIYAFQNCERPLLK